MRVTIVALALVWLAGPAAAISSATDTMQITVAGRRVTLVVPDGMCFLDDKVAWDRSQLDQQGRLDKGTNLMLAGMADCGELRKARSATIRRTTRFGQVKSSLPAVGNRPLAMTRAAFVQELAAAFRGPGAPSIADARQRLDAKLTGPQPFRIGEMINLGIVFEEPDLLGIAMAASMQQDGEKFTRLCVMSMTLVNGIPVSINLFREFRDGSTLGELVAESKTLARGMLKANPR